MGKRRRRKKHHHPKTIPCCYRCGGVRRAEVAVLICVECGEFNHLEGAPDYALSLQEKIDRQLQPRSAECKDLFGACEPWYVGIAAIGRVPAGGGYHVQPFEAAE